MFFVKPRGLSLIFAHFRFDDVTSGLWWRHFRLPWRHFRFASFPCWPSETRTHTRSQTSKLHPHAARSRGTKYGLLIGPNLKCCNLIGYAAYRSPILLFSTNHDSLLRIATNEIASFWINHRSRQLAFFSCKGGAKAEQKAGFCVMLKYFEIIKAFRYL